VRQNPFRAHAWVTFAGTPLFDSVERTAQFKPLAHA